MFRILLVEDNEDTLKELADYLSEALHRPQIDGAMDVKQAMERIGGTNLYDAVILDFKLPATLGENPEIDESVCKEIEAQMHSAFIAHISSFADDGKVQEHLRKIHAERVGNRVIFIPKSDETWPERLLEELKAFLFGTRIEARISNLFRDDSPPGLDGSRHHQFTPARNVTHDLAALVRDIAEHWDDLDNGLRSRARKFFRVEYKDGRVVVSLKQASN